MISLSKYAASAARIGKSLQRHRAPDSTVPRRTIQWHIAAQTHCGNLRNNNEDDLLVREDVPLLAIADGMGGHQAGDIASRMVISSLTELTPASSLHQAQQQTAQALLSSHQAIIDYSQHQLAGATAGSTAVVMLASGGCGVALWVGDSRLYRIRQEEIEQLTQDHSYVAQLVRDGLLSARDARHHPSANIITRAIGSNANLEIDTVHFDIMAGDIFVLCSDGLYNELDDDEIQAIANDNEAAASCAQLMQCCLSRPARDNISVIVAHAA